MCTSLENVGTFSHGIKLVGKLDGTGNPGVVGYWATLVGLSKFELALPFAEPSLIPPGRLPSGAVK
jgi:hypothetical protein